MTEPIVPAELAFAGDGTPFSPRYGDVYHSSHGGLDQARHVFLAGNDLPARWTARSRFVIFETGFGLGLNFLATWQAWRQQPGAGRRLHYLAVEKHPFRRDELKQLHLRWPELAALANDLHAQWPLPLPGLHRLDFGDVILTLCFGDAAELLPTLTLAADAIYLDGFAPDRNPELWTEQIAAQLARIAAAGATLATWSVAGEVRRRLASADFQVERRPGFGGKRDMLVGHRPGPPVSAGTRSSRRIAVIGAGIAGASIAHALAGRGHSVTVIDAAAGPAAGASGNHAGVFRPLPSQDDGKLARLLRAGFLLGRRQFGALSEVRCGWTGALHIARDEKHEETQRRIADAHALPADFCRYVTREEAAGLAAWPVARGGWWFPQAGWINPPSLCRSLLRGIDCRFDVAVSRLERSQGRWRIHGNEMVIEADEVVLANGIDAAALVPQFMLPIRPGRGQVSLVPEAATPAMNIVATRLGYVTPAVDGIRCAGATTQVDDLDPESRVADHVENLFRLDMLLPGFATGLSAEALQGRVSFRPMSPDRLPLVGPLSASEGLWINNGFGARGLVFASICAELLASQIDGDPLPLEIDLVRALDPKRYGVRAQTRTRTTL
ncbi:MAG: bifunctional tRNA (5-methylaminomethyl-2-thiouridine)(34)-methyltransferase MnmD/FAD-dependent 5-carboxymethylaminomethyl-2-thiouridine(34) oxidoreductase MnmC [Rhodocyclales bacterium]|nr:bifunctional tRNA (5-methylaminomethyl-2-thiouridine)(34)-methyltransferase MnmD/FAD-dependent 5-carboxymethylaminomethyl-2-thiouridine(34) oxidoreductase MnmC [Rhodocyclales bacterium]